MNNEAMTFGFVTAGRQIGPIGSVVRLCVGTGLLVAGVGAGPTMADVVGAVVVLPLVELAVVWVLRRPGAPPIHLYGARGYAVNFGIAGALWVLWTIPAMLFYGGSILLAFARGYAGCEILAISNLLRRRDDQLACAFFSPIDGLEGST